MSGCSKIDTIAILQKAFGIDLASGKKAVHLSPTWDDTRAADDEFQDMLEDLADAITSENDQA
jgi:hypothetical protein